MKRTTKGKEKLFILEAELGIHYEKTEIKTYNIKAGNLEDAKKKVLKEVKQDIGVKCIGVRNKTGTLPGIICFSIALFLSLMPYYKNDGFESVFLFPNMSALAVSLVLYSSFVIKVKGLENTFKGPADSIISLLFILVLAIFIKIFIRDSIPPSGSPIGRVMSFFKLNNSYTLITAAVILSWIGMKSVAGIIWIIIAVLGILQLVTAGNIMGEYIGAIFILSSFSGFIFYLKYEGKLIINSFKKITLKAIEKASPMSMKKLKDLN